MNPYIDDVFSGSLTTESTVPQLYREEIDRLVSSITAAHHGGAVRVGRSKGAVALLRSQVAGAGKSHLLARLAGEHADAALYCPIFMQDADEMCWGEWYCQSLDALHEARDSRGDQTVLTSRVAYFLASATSQLVSEGRIPCEGPAVASTWFREHSWKLFHHSERDNDSVKWFHSEFSVVLPELANLYAKELRLDEGELETTIQRFYDYAQLSATDAPASERRRTQREYLRKAGLLTCAEKESSAKSDLQMLGRLLSLEVPLVLVLDDLDWFYRDEASALRLARMLSEFSRLIPNGVAIISVNEDHWQETFEKGLPEAVRDRLTRQTLDLNGVPRDLWGDLVDSRLCEEDLEDKKGVSVLEGLENQFGDESTVSPRRLLRAAADYWDAPVGIRESKKEEAGASLTVVEESPSNGSEKAASESDSDEEAGGWGEAVGSLRSLIDARSKDDRSVKDPKPFQTSSSASKPDLTPEFRSFLTSLRARATDKEAYLPQKPSPSTERLLVRSELILHGRDTEASSGNAVQLAPNVVTPPWVDSRLRQIRVDLSKSMSSIGFSQRRLRRLVWAGGEFFPAIAQDPDNSPAEELAGLRWRFQQSEVNFGFRPFNDVDYWKESVAIHRRACPFGTRSREDASEVGHLRKGRQS